MPSHCCREGLKRSGLKSSRGASSLLNSSQGASGSLDEEENFDDGDECVLLTFVVVLYYYIPCCYCVNAELLDLLKWL